MFVRLQICHNKDGSTRSYLHLLRSRRVNGRTRQELVCTLGRLDVLQAEGGLDQLIAGLVRYSEKQWVQMQALEGGWQKVYGPVLVFRRLWEQLGLTSILTHMACLLGILHHVRPGFLSYPASHLTPYLRLKKYPPENFHEMYTYRDLRTRLIAKVERAYLRTMFTPLMNRVTWRVLQENTMHLSLDDDSVDAIISSPPYFGALDYARDNRLRLWFLGVHNWKELDRSLTASDQVYIPQMRQCLQELSRVLTTDGHCILVLGDVERNGIRKETAKIISYLAYEASNGRLVTKLTYSEDIPDDRRSRRRTKTTKCEHILVMQKVA